jgi:dolichol-phosphate mannosyltransferase
LHLTVLGVLLKIAGVEFLYSQLIATVFAMTVNFTVNNVFTFRARRLRGPEFARGLLFFYGVCGLGAFVNIQVAVYLFGLGVPWWGAGLIGMIIGAVWNFSVSTIVVWQREHRGGLAKAEPVSHEPEGLTVQAKQSEKP